MGVPTSASPVPSMIFLCYGSTFLETSFSLGVDRTRSRLNFSLSCSLIIKPRNQEGQEMQLPPHPFCLWGKPGTLRGEEDLLSHPASEGPKGIRTLASWLWTGACPFTLLPSSQKLKAHLQKALARERWKGGKVPILSTCRTHSQLKLWAEGGLTIFKVCI